MSCLENLEKIDRDNWLEKNFGFRVVRPEGYDDLDKINEENIRERILGKEYSRVGEPVRPTKKPINERFLEALNKYGSLSLNELIKLFPDYAYCAKELMVIEVNSGYAKESKENRYEITERGQQFLTYGFGKKFLKLHKR